MSSTASEDDDSIQVSETVETEGITEHFGRTMESDDSDNDEEEEEGEESSKEDVNSIDDDEEDEEEIRDNNADTAPPSFFYADEGEDDDTNTRFDDDDEDNDSMSKEMEATNKAKKRKSTTSSNSLSSKNDKKKSKKRNSQKSSPSSPPTPTPSTSTSTKKKKKKGPTNIPQKNTSLHDDESNNTPAVKVLVLPFRAIKRIMKLDADVGTVQNEAAVLVTYASELFLKKFAQESQAFARKKGRNTIRYEDVSEARVGNDPYAFLQPMLP